MARVRTTPGARACTCAAVAARCRCLRTRRADARRLGFGAHRGVSFAPVIRFRPPVEMGQRPRPATS